MLDVDALTAFLYELDQNNNRAWFEAQKPRYLALRNDFADCVQQVIYTIGEVDSHVQSMRAQDAIFRIHRDVRFARDKTPYKTTFSASISPEGRAAGYPGYYFEINAQGQLGAGAGVYMPEPAAAARIRTYISTHPIQVAATLQDPALRAAFPDGVVGESYKRAPRGFAEETPLIDLIKRKHFILWRDQPLPAGMTGDTLVHEVTAILSAAAPWILHLRSALRVE